MHKTIMHCTTLLRNPDVVEVEVAVQVIEVVLAVVLLV